MNVSSSLTLATSANVTIGGPLSVQGDLTLGSSAVLSLNNPNATAFVSGPDQVTDFLFDIFPWSLLLRRLDDGGRINDIGDRISIGSWFEYQRLFERDGTPPGPGRRRRRLQCMPNYRVSMSSLSSSLPLFLSSTSSLLNPVSSPPSKFLPSLFFWRTITLKKTQIETSASFLVAPSLLLHQREFLGSARNNR